jgi:hypothetical protein
MARSGKPKKSDGWKPGLMTLAVVAFWAAAHEPSRFSPASAGGWLLGAATVALLVRAGLALAAPLARLVSFLLGQAWREISREGEP